MPARKTALNLLPRSDLDGSWWGRFLKWALSAGRYIIILTEMVVIMAFLSRFKLDRDLSDLAERIEGKKNVLAALSVNEGAFRSIQKRLEVTKTMMEGGVPVDDLLTDIEKDLPNGVRLITIGMDEEKMSLNAETASDSGLGEFVRNVNSDPRWKSVELADVIGDRQGSVKFSVNLKW